MTSIVDREYVRQHPGEAIRRFGLMAFLHSLRSPRTDLLAQLADEYQKKGIAMPGPVGNSYKLSALLELRAARIYARLAERFSQNPAVKAFFEELCAEEQEHARIMLLCLYTIDSSAKVEFIPSVRDPQIHSMLRELRQIERNAWRMSFDEALETTEKLEGSEVNVIFERLVSQAQNPKNDFVVSQLTKAEGHAAAVPKRIMALREEVG